MTELQDDLIWMTFYNYVMSMWEVASHKKVFPHNIIYIVCEKILFNIYVT